LKGLKVLGEDSLKGAGGEVSQVKIFKKYLEGLERTEKFSHMAVMFWLNKVTSNLRRTLKS